MTTTVSSIIAIMSPIIETVSWILTIMSLIIAIMSPIIIED